MQVAASARPEPAVDIHDTYDGSDEEIERQLPATESAPRGARRFSEKYSENRAQVISVSLQYFSERGAGDAASLLQGFMCSPAWFKQGSC